MRIFYLIFLFNYLALKHSTSAGSIQQTQDEYHENLVIKPLKVCSRKRSLLDVLFHFEFLVTVKFDTTNSKIYQHYKFFPRQIGEMVQQHNVRSFELSFAQGTWFSEDWGYPPTDSALTGAKITGVVDELNDTENWIGLVNSLSGIYCASLNQASMENVVSSKSNFVGKNFDFFNDLNPDSKSYNTTTFIGFLPRENVCTENLTPFIKQLPCKNKAGIAQLLNPYKLFPSKYYSMSTYFSEHCEDGSQCNSKVWTFKQTVTTVLVAPYTSEISTENLFDRNMDTVCSIADSSKVWLLQEPGSDIAFDPNPLLNCKKSIDGDFTIFERSLLEENGTVF
ncbi:hypothetical protein BB560_001257 [Smittium megazygosporum]|uniref:Uncharacterized protein n=1 Tax=Smittium megazygosporum TaxID=133381 RepID=A0A2T9ZI32_9FUNG|nr:hypothetical protein BB560_001257 [Smittium megazygosporum]